MEEKWKKVNPVLPLDYPDPDVIRVDDTYYGKYHDAFYAGMCDSALL